MSNDLKINTSLDAEQRLQQLLQRQADIQAEIASLVPSSAPATSYQHHRSPINKHHHRRSVNGINVPRNGVSSSGATMARQLSDRIEAPSMRSKTLSQRSAPAPSMARTNSRGASSARSGNTPFVKNGSAIPRPFRPEPRQDRDQNLAVDTWMNDNDNAYTLSHQPPPLQQSMSQRFELEQVPELGVGENPLEFISRTMGTPTVAISPPFSTSSAATMSNMHLSNNSFNLPTPTTPTTDSLTEATTFASTMSRQNSLCNERMLESLQMMHVNSNTSYSTDVNSDQFMYDHVNSSFSSPNRRSSSEEQSQLLVGTGGVSHDSQFSHSFSSADDFSSVGYGEKMEKSQSSESSSSNASSASSRNKERLSKTNTLAAARPLMPKGESAENILSRANSSKSMTRLESKDGSQDNKIAISKPSYQRPKHDRVHCKLCENHPDGFRGEHELRRHQDREHKTMVRKWVCIEPTSPGHPKPEMPLSKCKACGTQRKKYGAYYNAAAHLRRTHFRPKAKGRGKNSKVDDVEKRGGKGGGDWPSMQELKHWMTEVEVPCDNYPSSNTQEDEAEAEAAESSDNEQENNLDELETISTQTNTHNNFDSYAYINDASPININATNNDMYSSMPLDLTGTEQSSCQLDASLYGNANFQVYSNDAAMAGFDFSTVPMINQGFDDSILNGTYF